MVAADSLAAAVVAAGVAAGSLYRHYIYEF